LLFALRKIIQRKFLNSKSTHSDDVEDEFTGKEALATNRFLVELNKEKLSLKGQLGQQNLNRRLKKDKELSLLKKIVLKLIVEPKK